MRQVVGRVSMSTSPPSSLQVIEPAVCVIHITPRLPKPVSWSYICIIMRASQKRQRRSIRRTIRPVKTRSHFNPHPRCVALPQHSTRHTHTKSPKSLSLPARSRSRTFEHNLESTSLIRSTPNVFRIAARTGWFVSYAATAAAAPQRSVWPASTATRL